VTFSTTYATLLATLDTPGGTSTGWSLPLTLTNGSYAVTVTAVDAVGNTDSTPPWVPFGVDTVAPDVTDPDGSAASPATNEVFTVNDVVLSGSATDDVGVTKVKLAIRDTVGKLWLQPDGVR